jgi:hypothetical protein
MTAITAPSTFRTYAAIPTLNNSQNDFVSASGIRVSCPLYVDLPNNLRKQLLNGVRSKASEVIIDDTPQPQSISGIQVSNSASLQPAIETYLGMAIDNLRNVLFQRGGLEASLVLKLEQVTGIEVLSPKDWAAAFKVKQTLVKDFSTSYPFPLN